VAYRIELAPAALADLQANFLYLAEAAGIDTAVAQDTKIRAACLALADFPNRGRPRDAIRTGLRSMPFGRALTIFYVVEEDHVQVVRLLHARRDSVAAFQDN